MGELKSLTSKLRDQNFRVVFFFKVDGKPVEVVTRSPFDVVDRRWVNRDQLAAVAPRGDAVYFERAEIQVNTRETRLPAALVGKDVDDWWQRLEAGIRTDKDMVWQTVGYMHYDSALPPGARLIFEPGQVSLSLTD